MHLSRRISIRAVARGAEVAVDGVSKDDGGGQGDDAEHHEAVEEVALQLLPPWSAKGLLIRLFYPMLVSNQSHLHSESCWATHIFGMCYSDTVSSLYIAYSDNFQIPDGVSLTNWECRSYLNFFSASV